MGGGISNISLLVREYFFGGLINKEKELSGLQLPELTLVIRSVTIKITDLTETAIGLSET
jgi:hypothetical protein